MGNVVYNLTSGVTTSLGADDATTTNLITVPASSGSMAVNTSLTGAINLPTGTTAQRPASPAVGMQRWNTTLNALEVYVGGGTWTSLTSTSYAISYLAVAGGGGGCYGGGGAGGMLQSLATVQSGVSYAITIGAGGTGSTTVPTNGADTVAAGIATATGGGHGALGAGSVHGAAGGSGGGAGSGGTGGAGVIGQGHNGGSCVGMPNAGAGGGGAGAQGQDAPSNGSGDGGAGLTSSISGSTAYYAGGGAGVGNGTTSSGGVGGGGASGATTGVAGTANSGGGGGGAGTTPGAGGSGVFILSYVGTPRGTGGTITQVGGNTIHTFTASSTFVG